MSDPTTKTKKKPVKVPAKKKSEKHVGMRRLDEEELKSVTGGVGTGVARPSTPAWTEC